MTVEEALKIIEAAFVAEHAGEHCAVIQIDLTDTEGRSRSWQVCVDGGACTCVAGTPNKPRITAAMNENDFIALVTEKLRPDEAYFTNKVKLTGDVMLASIAHKWFDRTPAAMALRERSTR
jgi:putative sterol carrier protein